MCWVDLPGLIRRKLFKEIWVFLILLTLGAGLSIAFSLHVKLPSPVDWVMIVYKPLGDLLGKIQDKA